MMELWAFVSGTWKLLFILFFIFLISSLHISFLFMSLGGEVYRRPKRSILSDHYTEVSIIIVYSEREGM